MQVHHKDIKPGRITLSGHVILSVEQGESGIVFGLSDGRRLTNRPDDTWDVFPESIKGLTTGRLSPDGGVTGFTVEATYDPTNRWSGGIAAVFVTKDEADRIVKHNSPVPAGEEGSLYWEGEEGRETNVLAYVDYDGVTHISPDTNGLYEVGFGWCWEEVEEERPTPANSTAHQNAVALTKKQIVEDVQKKVVPPTVRDFSHLHDFVDANEYGGLTDDEIAGSAKFSTGEEWISFCNGVADEVDAWIKSGALTEDRTALVFTIDVTGMTTEQRNNVEAAVSAQLDDGTEDYPAPASYEYTVLDHDTDRPILSAVQVGLGL